MELGIIMSVWRNSVTGIRFSVISLRAIFRRSINLVSNLSMWSAVVVPNEMYVRYYITTTLKDYLSPNSVEVRHELVALSEVVFYLCYKENYLNPCYTELLTWCR